MPKTKKPTQSQTAIKSSRFSETNLVVFFMIFATLGSYLWLKSFAATDDASYLAQSHVTPEESAWFSSITGASAIILASGPIAIFILWWIWRRSAFGTWMKLVLTVLPIVVVMRFA